MVVKKIKKKISKTKKKKEPEKKSFLSRLKEKIIANKKGIAIGAAVAATAGAAAYAYNRNKKQQMEIEKLKKIPLPSTLNINSLKEYFKTSQSNLESLYKEKEQFYQKYTSEIGKFTEKLDQLARLEESLKTASQEEKAQINSQIVILQTTLKKIQEENEELQNKLNAKIKEYNLSEKIHEDNLKDAIKITEQQNISNDEKEKQLQALITEKTNLLIKINDEKLLSEQRETVIKEVEKKYKRRLALLTGVKQLKINALESELKSKTGEFDKLEQNLHIAVSNIQTFSETIKSNNEKLEKLQGELTLKAGLSTEQVQQLKLQISNLQTQLSDEGSKFAAKQAEINKLQTDIAGKKITEVIDEYQAKLKEYNAKNVQLVAQQGTDELKNQGIKKQIEQNNTAYASLKADLEKIIEVERKIQKDNEKLKKLKAQQSFQKLRGNLDQKSQTRQLEAKKIISEKRIEKVKATKNINELYKKLVQDALENGFHTEFIKAINNAEAEKKERIDNLYKPKKVSFGNVIEIKYLTSKEIQSIYDKLFEKANEKAMKEKAEAEAEKQRQEQIKKMESMISDLKNLTKKPKYITDLLSICDKDKTPLNYINTYSIYQNLSLYNDNLYNDQTSLTNLYSQVKKYITENIATFIDQAKAIQKEYLITEFEKSDEMKKTSVDINPPFENLKNTISILLNNFIKLKDDIFPVRIVINFGKELPKKSPVTEPSVPLKNYNDSLTSDNKNIKNILYNQISPENGLNLSQTSDGKKILKDNIYGPFYTVTNTTDNTYDVKEDVNRIFNKNKNDTKIPHLIYSAYGFSGSGKSYTLIQTSNKNNVLTRVIKAIEDIAPPKMKENLKLRYSIYDYYGENPDPLGCMVLPGDTNISNNYHGTQKINSFTEITGFVANQVIPLRQYPLIDIGIKNFERERQKNYAKLGGAFDDLTRSKYHIRYTPNNDQSSRSHLFVDIDILNGDHEIGRISIIDMAGSEDVDTIQQSYFTNLPTVYNSQPFISSLDNISKKLDKIATNLKNVSSQFGGGLGFDKLINTISDTLIFGLIHLEQVTKNGNFIIKEAWNDLMDNFKKLGITYPDMKDFIDNYNFYNYIIFIRPIFEALKISIEKLLQMTNIKNDDCIDLSQLSNYFEQVGVGQMTKKYFNIKSFDNGLIIAPRNENNNAYKNNKTKYMNAFKKALKEKLNNLPTFINSSNHGLFGQLVILNINEIEENPLQKQMLISGKITINGIVQTEKQIKDKINLWNRRYLYNIHCSLRYQGNFIVNTLEQMVQYISCLQNNKILDTKFPGDILHTNLDIKGQTRRVLKNSQPKFILFTNIRLDFSTHGRVLHEKITQNTNIRNAYINSIDFANKINPLTGKMESCKLSGITLFGKRKSKIKGKVSKGKNKKVNSSLLKHIKFLKSLSLK